MRPGDTFGRAHPDAEESYSASSATWAVVAGGKAAPDGVGPAAVREAALDRLRHRVGGAGIGGLAEASRGPKATAQFVAPVGVTLPAEAHPGGQGDHGELLALLGAVRLLRVGMAQPKVSPGRMADPWAVSPAPEPAVRPHVLDDAEVGVPPRSRTSQ